MFANSVRVNTVSALLLAGGKLAHLPTVPHSVSSPRSCWQRTWKGLWEWVL